MASKIKDMPKKKEVPMTREEKVQRGGINSKTHKPTGASVVTPMEGSHSGYKKTPQGTNGHSVKRSGTPVSKESVAKSTKNLLGRVQSARKADTADRLARKAADTSKLRSAAQSTVAAVKRAPGAALAIAAGDAAGKFVSDKYDAYKAEKGVAREAKRPTKRTESEATKKAVDRLLPKRK